MPGFPDGQGYPVWRGPDFFASASFSISASNPIQANGNVTNYASVAISLGSTPVGGIQVVAQFFVDATMAVQTYAVGWVVPQGFSLSVIIPAIGNFCQITISTPTVAGTVMFAAILPTNTQVSAPSYVQALNVTEQASVGIPAGTTTLFPFPCVTAGEFHLFVDDIAASTHLGFSVVTLNENGTGNVIVLNIPAPVTNATADFVMDEEPLAVSIHNSDAVQHNASFLLACVPKAG